MTNWNPEDYHQHSSQQQKWAKEVLGKLAFRSDEAVLDIGCGDGKVTAEIARAVPRGRVVGMDASAEMIAFAERTFPAGTFGNLRFQEGDARALSFDAEFDCVVSFACLHWVIDHRPMLKGIARSLCRSGRILLQFGGKGNAAEVVQTMMEIIRQPKWAGYFAGVTFPWGFYSPEEYRPWLTDAGLRAIRVELIPKDMTHRGPAGLADWLRTTWMPYVQRVPVGSRQAFLDEIAGEYLLGHPLDRKGNVHLKMMRLEVEAVKQQV